MINKSVFKINVKLFKNNTIHIPFHAHASDLDFLHCKLNIKFVYQLTFTITSGLNILTINILKRYFSHGMWV